MASDTPRRRPWIIKWLGDEEFWKGIAIQTLGTLSAAAVVTIGTLIVARDALSSKTIYYLIYGISVTVLTAVLLILGMFFMTMATETAGRAKRRAIKRAIYFAICVGVVSFMVYLWDVLSRGIGHLTGFNP